MNNLSIVVLLLDWTAGPEPQFSVLVETFFYRSRFVAILALPPCLIVLVSGKAAALL